MSLKNVTNLKELSKEEQKQVRAGDYAASCADRYGGQQRVEFCRNPGLDPYDCYDILC